MSKVTLVFEREKQNKVFRHRYYPARQADCDGSRAGSPICQLSRTAGLPRILKN